MPKPEFVRVKTDGGEITVTKANAKRHKFEVLDKDAVDATGQPLPPKPRTSKGGRRTSSAPVTPTTTEPAAPADNKKEG
jgi:hypothetical protein